MTAFLAMAIVLTCLTLAIAAAFERQSTFNWDTFAWIVAAIVCTAGYAMLRAWVLL